MTTRINYPIDYLNFYKSTTIVVKFKYKNLYFIVILTSCVYIHYFNLGECGSTKIVIAGLRATYRERRLVRCLAGNY